MSTLSQDILEGVTSASKPQTGWLARLRKRTPHDVDEAVFEEVPPIYVHDDAGDLEWARSSACDDANCLSSLVLWWMTPVVTKRTEESLPVMPRRYKFDVVAPKAAVLWEEEMRRAKEGKRLASFEAVLWRMWKGILLKGLVWSAVAGLTATVARPLVLLHFITDIEGDVPAWNLYLHVGAMFLVLALEGIALAQTRHYLADHFGAAYVATTAALLKQKVLDTPGGASNEQEGALFGTDCFQTRALLENLCYLPIGVFTLLGGLPVLAVVSGWVCVFGLGAAFVLLSTTALLNEYVKTLLPKMLEKTDGRVGITTQIVESIKAIKYSAWEEQFLALVTAARRDEIKLTFKYRRAMMAAVAVGRCTPIVSACTTFVALSLLGYDLRSGSLFATYVVFQSLRVAWSCIPSGLTQRSSVATVTKRFGAYLIGASARKLPYQKEPHIMASVTNAVFERAGAPALRVPELRVKLGEVTAVVGKMGSGKTTLLTSLLGDLSLQEGDVHITSDVGYVPQRAFVTAGTVLENVTMGRPYDEERLHWALESAQLLSDVMQFPDGIDTAIGERGGTLSGGQQHRLGLARALYGQPALLVLDDPLAAVDRRVAAALFDAFLDYAAGGRAVVVVMNQPRFYRECHNLVVLENLVAVHHGSYLDLIGRAACAGLLSCVGESPATSAASSPPLTPASPSSPRRRAWKNRDLSTARLPLRRKRVEMDYDSDAKSDSTSPPSLSATVKSVLLRSLVSSPSYQDLKRPAQKFGEKPVPGAVFARYFRAMGWCNVVMAVVALVCLQGCSGFADRWLAIWVDAQNDHRAAMEVNATLSPMDNAHYIWPYVGVALGTIPFAFCFAHLTSRAAAKGSVRMHDDVLESLMHAPMAWFQKTSSGDIISRLGSDIVVIDVPLSTWCEHCLVFVFSVLNLSVILILIAPPMAVVLAVSFALYWLQVRSVDLTKRYIKRLADDAKAPVLSTFSELCQGRTLLRAMGLENYAQQTLANKVDLMVGRTFLGSSVTSWQSLWSYILSAFLCGCASAYMVYDRYNTSSSDMGLALTYCFTFPYFMLFLSLNFGFFRLNMTAVERLLDYSGDKVEREPEWTPEDPPAAAWPSAGVVEFKNAVLQYSAHTKPALNGVNLSIGAKQRYGIVGRTGAGKSSLVVLLFRIWIHWRGR
eukprot:TRINITY_DN4008_c0_g1_i4.p1 TRINITY_DN4008_c0_g1~~TRINITY_DN4008_c0_g1_i4.p1  ORF type:complete len:1181 (+),score=242.87 TRINITY_DN4008_c0_g1_i4:59-3544(+)